LAVFGLAALFAWASSASAALSTTENTTGPVGSVDDRAPAPPTNVVAEANLVDFQGELSWDLSADDFVRQSPTGDDFTSGGTFVRTNDVASYQIWRSALGGDYELIDTVDGGQVSYIDTSVESGVPYTYAVTSVDGAGNASDPVESELVSFGPPGEAETELPPEAEPVVQEVTIRLDLDLDLEDETAVEEFTASFIQLIADLLGIDASRIIITGLESGSVIVNFEIADDPDSPASEAVAQLSEVVETDPQVFADAGLGTLLDYQAAQTTSISFGEVAADADASTTLSFTNSSTEDDAVLIVSSSVEGVGFFAFPEKLSLANGESGDIDVSFAAADVGNVNGTYTGTLTIITNDPNNKLMVIALSATVVGGLTGAVADVSTRSISFPRTAVGNSSSRDLIISNKGGLPLSVTVSISGDDEISLSEEGTFSLDAGESQTISVVFSPTEAIAYSASIMVMTDDAAHPHIEISASGTGVPEGGPPSLIDENGNEVFGDFDGDASVTFDDFFQFADNFGLTSSSANWDPAFDLNGDDAVTFDDFFIFADNFGKSGTYASTEVIFTANLDSEQEGGGFTEAGTGVGDFSYTDDGGLTYEIIVENLTGPITGSHIHNAAAGTSGGVVHALTFTEESAGVWVASGTWDSSNGLTSALIDELKAGRLYVNIHTAAHASGEIRGQIEE
jgi:hypothetical protein